MLADRDRRLPVPSNCFAIIGAVVGMWMIIGVPVAAAIAALRVFVWVIFGVPEMVVTAISLGMAHGLWLCLAGRPSDPNSRDFQWSGAVTGGILGLLGFPPVFSRIDAIIADRLMVAVFLLAAMGGGIASGFAAVKIVAMRLRPYRSARNRTIIIGCLLVIPLAVVDYHFFWYPMVDRLPVPPVSRETAMNISTGDARGSTWSGCYQYLGQFSLGSGLTGKEGGLLRVAQSGGSLTVSDGSAGPLVGGVNSSGRFRFGVERTTGQDALRMLWEGQFNDNSVDFTRRLTVVRGINVISTTRLTGTAQRITCNP